MLPNERTSLRDQVIAHKPGSIRWGDVAAVTLLSAILLYLAVHLAFWFAR